MSVSIFKINYKDATQEIKDKRTADVQIAEKLGYRLCEFVNTDGDDCYSLISPSGKLVSYDNDESMPYSAQFFMDSVWWYMCPQFTKFMEEREI